MKKKYKIAVAGTGYVGLSIATLLAQHHEVWAVDIIPEKVEMINHRKSPIQDEYIEKYLLEKELALTATLDAKEAYMDADFVVIAAPTNYDSKKNFFDTSAVEAVIELGKTRQGFDKGAPFLLTEPTLALQLTGWPVLRGDPFPLHANCASRRESDGRQTQILISD